MADDGTWSTATVRFEASLDKAKDLERHVESFTCSACDKSFGGRGSLKEHVKTIHENIKPFRCASCDKSFGRKGHLKRHSQTVHKNKNKNTKKQFGCTICNKSFGRTGHLKRHVETVHKKVPENQTIDRSQTSPDQTMAVSVANALTSSSSSSSSSSSRQSGSTTPGLSRQSGSPMPGSSLQSGSIMPRSSIPGSLRKIEQFVGDRKLSAKMSQQVPERANPSNRVDRNSNQIDEHPFRCCNSCGFYGNQDTNGLCSVCYNESIKKVENIPTAAKGNGDAQNIIVDLHQWLYNEGQKGIKVKRENIDENQANTEMMMTRQEKVKVKIEKLEVPEPEEVKAASEARPNLIESRRLGPLVSLEMAAKLKKNDRIKTQKWNVEAGILNDNFDGVKSRHKLSAQNIDKNGLEDDDDNDDVIRCKTCRLTFESYKLLSMHLDAHFRSAGRASKKSEVISSSDDEDEYSLKCPLCGVKLESQSGWSKHLYKHAERRRLKAAREKERKRRAREEERERKRRADVERERKMRSSEDRLDVIMMNDGEEDQVIFCPDSSCRLKFDSNVLFLRHVQKEHNRQQRKF